MTERVLVVGLDGADREALMQGMNDGSLPTLASIASEGDIGLLRAPQPPLTPVSMATMLTGEEPEVHGISCFETDGRYVDRRDIRAPTLFEDVDAETVSINVPMTSPPPERGLTVVGFPQATDTLASDPELDERLRRTGYRVEPPEYEDPESFREAVFDCAEHRSRVAEDLIDRDWELFFLMYTGDARLQHYTDDPAVTRSFYEQVDDHLGRLLEETGDDVSVVVLSDHGFTDHRATFNMEQWLVEEGYLVTEDRGTDDALYARSRSRYDEGASAVVPMGAYMAPLRVMDDGAGEEVREALLDVSYPETGEDVFRDVIVWDGGRELVPVPRRGFGHRCWDGDLFDHDPEERRVPDDEGVIMTDHPMLLPDGAAEMRDVLPMLRGLLEGGPGDA